MMTDQVDPAAKSRAARKTTFLIIAIMVPWTVGWIMLMDRSGFPKSFGFDLGRGKGALIMAYIFSYLLVERHHWWDLALFTWMWGPVVGLAGWLARKRLSGWTRPRFSLFDEAP
jgi:hypothetical protein